MAVQTVFRRYELKYLLTMAQKETVLKAMQPYMTLDKYGRTTIRNLYYDTDSYLLIRCSIEKPAYKEKLRIRSYSQTDDNSTVFVELKKKYKHNNIDGALFSKQDLTLNGSGSLTVTSSAGHGIVCKDDLVVTGGTYVVNSASHGLDANDSVRIAEAALTIDAGKDAIHCENSEDAAKGFIYISGGTIKAEAEGDGIAASAYMQIADGTIDLLVGGGSENGSKAHSDNFGGFMGGGHGGGRPGQMGSNDSQSTTTEENSTSMKGLKAANGMLISGGNITVNSADDAIHSDVSLTINGGTFALASGDDAVHAEDTLTVTAGKIDISESYEGLEALHIDVQGGDARTFLNESACDLLYLALYLSISRRILKSCSVAILKCEIARLILIGNLCSRSTTWKTH